MTAPTAEERERVRWMMTQPGAVFVFGSNLRGIHGAGAARDAVAYYGARRGVGHGWQGRSYAIPTKRDVRHRLAIDEIAPFVSAFLVTARYAPGFLFVCTRVGCGYAGYGDGEMAPLFHGAPLNVELPPGWRAVSDAIMEAPHA